MWVRFIAPLRMTRRGKRDEATSKMPRGLWPFGEGVSGNAVVAIRCVILWGMRGRWRLVSHGEGMFCETFKAGK